MALERPGLSILDLVITTAKDEATDQRMAPLSSFFHLDACKVTGIEPPPPSAYTCAYTTAKGAEQASARWSAQLPGASFIHFDPAQDSPPTAPFDLIVCRGGNHKGMTASLHSLLASLGRLLVLTPLQGDDESWGVSLEPSRDAMAYPDSETKPAGPSIAIIERRSNCAFASQLARTLKTDTQATIQMFRWDETLPSFTDQTSVVC